MLRYQIVVVFSGMGENSSGLWTGGSANWSGGWEIQVRWIYCDPRKTDRENSSKTVRLLWRSFLERELIKFLFAILMHPHHYFQIQFESIAKSEAGQWVGWSSSQRWWTRCAGGSSPPLANIASFPSTTSCSIPETQVYTTFNIHT